MTRRNGPAELAVLYAVRNAGWLTKADRAAVLEARLLARQLDELTRPAAADAQLFPGESPPPAAEVAGKVGYVSNSLLAVLGQLGLTPAGRAGMRMPDLGGDDETIAEIRAIRSRPQVAAGGEPEHLGS